MKVIVFSGDETASFSIPSQWAVEDDDKAAGGGFVAVRWIPGFNHLVSASAAFHRLSIASNYLCTVGSRCGAGLGPAGLYGRIQALT